MPEKKRKRGYYIPLRPDHYLIHKDGEYFEFDRKRKIIYNPENLRRKKNIKRHWLQKIKKMEFDKSIELIRIDGQLDSLIYNAKKKNSKNIIREIRKQERPNSSTTSHGKIQKKKKGIYLNDEEKKIEEKAGKYE